MTRTLGSYVPKDFGKLLVGGEPLVFHCNHYNYWLQHTLRLNPDVDMDEVIVAAAEEAAYAQLGAISAELELGDAAARLAMAGDVFSQQGFGVIDFSGASDEGGTVRTPVSHYGDMLKAACEGEIKRRQNLFDEGFAAAALAIANGRPAGSYVATKVECKSVGASEGRFEFALRPEPLALPKSPGQGHHESLELPSPAEGTSVDEPAILQALAGLDFSGNEEGLTPRFGVILTHHYSNFYNRAAFEFARRMSELGMADMADDLLVEAGHRCAFNTFGGIMTSAEWEAVVQPQCATREDWIHGIVAVVNALGWGVWRVHELTPDSLTIRIYDDYEGSAHRGMHGNASRPMNHLAQGGVAGLMNLVYVGDILAKPALDAALYERVFEHEDRFVAKTTQSLSMGAGFTEIVAKRGQGG